MELTDRKLKILQAIITDYVTSAEPVGSRTLSKKFDLGISPATIRNEMSDLEEMGYLTHPHTSAGRVPSDKAYRLYVNNMMEKHELSTAEKNIIAERLRSNVQEFDETIKHAAKLLSEITNLTSFALTPSQSEDTVKFVNLLPVDESTVVLMIASESGKISNTALRIRVPYTEEGLQLLAKTMTYTYNGKKISDVLTNRMIAHFESDIEAMSRLAEDIMPNFMKTLEDMLNVNLTRKLLEREDGVIVTIGGENADDSMNDCSLITATYHIDGKMVGKIGVIGPTRMKYDEITSIMEYLTDNLTQAFQLEYKEK